MITLLRQELDAVRGGYIVGMQHVNELEFLPPARLQQLHVQLRRDLERLEKVYCD